MDDPTKHYLQRAKQHEPDQGFPHCVELRLVWRVNGHERVRVQPIGADQFFGNGGHGAPMSGDVLIKYIENMRRAGPPPVEQKGKKNGVRKTKR